MKSESMLTPREKSPLSEKFSSAVDRTHDATSSRTASPTHYPLSYSDHPPPPPHPSHHKFPETFFTTIFIILVQVLTDHTVESELSQQHHIRMSWNSTNTKPLLREVLKHKRSETTFSVDIWFSRLVFFSCSSASLRLYSSSFCWTLEDIWVWKKQSVFYVVSNFIFLPAPNDLQPSGLPVWDLYNNWSCDLIQAQHKKCFWLSAFKPKETTFENRECKTSETFFFSFAEPTINCARFTYTHKLASSIHCSLATEHMYTKLRI